MNRRTLLTAGLGVACGAFLRNRTMAEPDARSLVEQLGYKADDRLLLIHADDLGMCHSVNAASTKAMTEGSVSSGSVMVPCPWFPEIAAWSREHPEADLGLHLALTSEWRYYRWRPVAPLDQVKGLLDEEGYLWRSEKDVKKHATPREVETEIRAQIERARKFGMKPTHVDSHMGTLFESAEFFEVYTRVARELDVMPMLPGPTFEILLHARAQGIDYPALVTKMKGAGYVFLDRLVLTLNGGSYEARKQALSGLVETLRPGVTQLIVHLSGNDEEIRHVTGNWENRYNEFRLFTAPETKRLLEDKGVKPITYRQLGKLWRK